MPRFAANLTMLFQEVDFLERFAQAKNAGFEFVEYLFPYSYDADVLQQHLKKHSLQQVLFNLPPGDWDAGERGIACLPDRIDEFKLGVEQAIQYAKTLNVPRLNCLAGLRDERFSEPEMWDTLVQNLRYAASALNSESIELVFEPINSRIDMPGFFIDTLERSEKLISDVAHSNLGLQFDLYHMQIMHDDLIRDFMKYQKVIKHIQFADNPGRHEPGTGEIDFESVFQAIDALGYPGFVSAEYIPSTTTINSLSWLRSFN